METLLLILILVTLPGLLIAFSVTASKNRKRFMKQTVCMEDDALAEALGVSGDKAELCSHIRRHVASQAGVPPESLHPEHRMEDIARMYMYDWDNSIVLFAIDEYLASKGLDSRDCMKLASHMHLDNLMLEGDITLGSYLNYIVEAVNVVCFEQAKVVSDRSPEPMCPNGEE